MTLKRKSYCRAMLVAAFLSTAAASGHAKPVPGDEPRAMVIAQGRQTGTEPRDLEPRYQPPPPEERSWYNSSYIFGMTRGVAGSTMVPAAKVPLFVLTVPLDLVFLPFAAIGGLFG